MPLSCLPEVPDSDNELNANYEPSHVNSPPPDNSLSNTASCFYSGKTYEDGAQWISTQVLLFLNKFILFFFSSYIFN